MSIGCFLILILWHQSKTMEQMNVGRSKGFLVFCLRNIPISKKQTAYNSWQLQQHSADLLECTFTETLSHSSTFSHMNSCIKVVFFYLPHPPDNWVVSWSGTKETVHCGLDGKQLNLGVFAMFELKTCNMLPLLFLLAACLASSAAQTSE